MLEETLTALAAAGGTAIVQAAGTDAWVEFRTRLARLLGRGDAHRERAESERLEQTAASLSTAIASDSRHVRMRQEASWQTRLEIFLESITDNERAHALTELRELVLCVAAPTNVSARDGGVAVGGHVTINPISGSVAAAVIQGDVTVAAPQLPDPAKSQRAKERELQRQQKAAEMAAYNRFLSSIPTPWLKQVSWHISKKLSRRLFGPLEYEASEPAYFVHDIDKMLAKISSLTASVASLNELSAYLGTLRFQHVTTWHTNYQIYSAREVDQYLNDLRSQLSMFFQECA